jgi:hypothetical protein
MARVGVRFGPGTIVAAGVVAGLLFAAFEVIAAALMMGPAAAFMPLRMIGAMVLGSAALDPGYSLAVAATAGVVVHMILSVAFTAVFAFIASPIATTGRLALAGMAFGTGLWLVNFYVIAPLAGWTWFPEQTNAVVQFAAHAFFFGGPIGWMLGRSAVVPVAVR